MGIIVRWIILTLAVIASSYAIEGIYVENFTSALFAAAFLGLLNVVLRPILLILTLPINVLTFGLFTFVINAFLIITVSEIVPGFKVAGFWAAVLGALVISVVNWILSALVRDGRGSRRQYRRTAKDRTIIDLRDDGSGRWE